MADEVPPSRLSISVERRPNGDVEARLPPSTQTSVALHLAGRCRLEWGSGAARWTGRPARGDVTIVPRGRSGQLRVRGGPTEILKITIPDVALAAWADGAERAWDGADLLDRFAIADPLIRSIGLALLAEADRGGAIDLLYRDSLSDALIAHLVRRHSEVEAGPSTLRRVHPLGEARARRAVDFMESRLDAVIGLDDIARELGLSTSHFGAQFRAAFGRSPARYLTWLRLDRARALLDRGGSSVSEIARAVGFKSLSHFSQAFAAEFGASPAAYRRERGGAGGPREHATTIASGAR